MLLASRQIVDELAHQPGTAPGRQRMYYWRGTCGLALFMSDCIALLLALAISLVFLPPVSQRAGTWIVEGRDLAILCGTICIYLAVKGRYSQRIPFWSEVRLVVCTSCYAFVFEILICEVSNNVIAKIPVLVALLLFPTIAVAANALAKHQLARAGIWIMPAVVVGNRQQVADAELALKSDRSLGYLIVGSVNPATIMSATAGRCLRTVLDIYQADCLLIASSGAEMPHRCVIERALQERISFAMLVQPYPAPTFAFRPTCIFSHDTMLLSFQNGLSRPIPRIAKSVMDVVISLSLLLVIAPVFLAISAAILQDGGPILFRQRRIGAGGKPFYCLKFRTMVVDADRALEVALAKDPDLAAEWEARRKLADDPRITRCGRFLRKASLDELPQLMNVLRRDMSLVGPRPIVEGEIPLYGENIAQYYATRPGLTGLWQVTGRSNTSYDRRVQLDVWYVNNWTIWHDITVLLKTIPAVFNREGAC